MTGGYDYILNCINCGNRRVSNGQDLGDLVEVKTTPIPAAPGKKPIEQPRKFKCPNCGHCFRASRTPTETQVWPPLPTRKDPTFNFGISEKVKAREQPGA